MAITASFSLGVLTVTGDADENFIIISRNLAGDIFVNGGSVAISGGTPTVANTTVIVTNGQALNDVTIFDETSGALPRAFATDSGGNDTLTGGTAGDTLGGGDDNDELNGKGGADLLFGDDDDDILIGGDGDDQVFGGDGDDRLIWNAGDDNDVLEGGENTDIAEVFGNGVAEVFTVAANGARVRLDRTDPASSNLDIGTTESLQLDMGGGNDTFSASGNLAALIGLTVNGGDGNDTILGGNGDDVLLGDNLLGAGGNDFIDGNQGDDTAFMGAGDDVFQWDQGDGSDVVSGGSGSDTVLFNGDDTGETLEVSPTGEQDAVFIRDGEIVMDFSGVEHVVVNALGGADTFTMSDLSGIDVRKITVNLAGTLGGNTGDGQADTVSASGDGTSDLKDNLIAVASNAAGTVTVTGLGAALVIEHGESNDQLILGGGSGDDIIDASRFAADQMRLRLDGSFGADTFVGSEGDDLIDGGKDNDVALMGGGNDTFVYNQFDGSDTIEGDRGSDTLLFNSDDASETIAITAFGERARLFSDNRDVTIHLNEVERIVYSATDGNKTIVIDDLSSTDVTLIEIDAGLGDDTIDGSHLTNSTSLLVKAGAGADKLTGGGANDTFISDVGDGNDTIEGGDGADRVLLRGAAGDDRIDVTAIGERVRAFRNTDDATISMNGVEVITLAANEGADSVRVRDLSGTDVRTVAILLGENDQAADTVFADGTNGNDAITVTGSSGSIEVNGMAAQVTISGVAGENDTLAILGLDGNDTIDASALAAGAVVNLALDAGGGDDTLLGSQGADVINGSDGNDTASYAASLAGVNVNLATGINTGGDAQGDEFFSIENIIGSANADTLTGDDADNTLQGGAGADTLIGGAGDNVLIGGAGEDTAVFNVDFNTVDVVFEGNKVFIESAEGRDEVSGIESFQFTDGTIHLDDGNVLVNDLFYFAANKDVWDAGIDADDHYNAVGWLEGRDPSASFSTNGYLSANADVRAAHINPLLHFDQVGWREGRDPSAGFDVEVYLEQNPDVAAAGINPLAHFEAVGRAEGRDAFPAIGHVNHEGFDAEFYLLGNSDVGFAGVDPFFHYRTVGFHEGRDPNAFFDTEGYLAAYGDVAAAGIDPLAHYMSVGVHEGRDPSGAFDTAAYLAANPDVAAARVNPLLHFLNSGVHEGRLPLGDGIFA
jgi:Ca2+-binding RTX toxin-like protein